MPSKTIRFSDELAARVQAVADAEDRSFGYVVKRALESALATNSSDRVDPAGRASAAGDRPALTRTSRADAFRAAAERRR